MKKLLNRNVRKGERGNVLFLILIAVALFAALSYAVTSSSRSGGSDANSETNLISGATITQYPASVRTAIIRMIVSNNIGSDELMFNPPAQYGDVGYVTTQGVFHPDGGGATFAPAPADVVIGSTPQDWVFNAENEIYFVGVSGTTEDTVITASADIIAFLPNVQRNICERINEELGVGAPPVESGIDISTEMENTTGILSAAGGGTIGDYTVSAGTASDLNAQPYGCFQQPAGTYNYYHVLVER